MPRRTVASPFTAKVGARIRELRLARGWTVAQLAQRADVAKGHLSSAERGLAAITIETIDRLGKGLELPPFYLLTFAAEDERARIADLLRALPADDLPKLRREIQIRVGLYKQ